MQHMTSDLTPGTIVVGVDGSDSSRQALAWAADQAMAEHRPLTLACAVGVTVPVSPAGAALPLEYREALRAEGRAALGDARADLARRTPDLEVHEVIETADPRTLLIQLSERAAMVVVGSRGRGPVASLLLGSVGVALSRHAACPVVVHRPMNRGLVRNGIVVGADATPSSLPVLELAYRQASIRDLPLLVLHCFWDLLSAGHLENGEPPDYEEERAMFAESIAGMAEKYPEVRVRTELAHGVPADAILKAGERMDLVVVGAHQARGSERFMFGSVSVSVVEHATCPVAVVPVRHEAD
jgi:nucleotide-binding universal stress UspA family protein